MVGRHRCHLNGRNGIPAGRKPERSTIMNLRSPRLRRRPGPANRRRLIPVGVIGIVAVAVAQPAYASTVAPAAVHCGDTLTTSTILTVDLNCINNGITIGADNVVFDLNGHSIGGLGDGITVGHTDDTVTNGRLAGPTLAVRGASNLTLSHLRFTAGSDLDAGSGPEASVRSMTVADSVFRDGSAIGLRGCHAGGCVFRHSTFTGATMGSNDNTSTITITAHCVFRNSSLRFTETNGIRFERSTFVASPIRLLAGGDFAFVANTFRGSGVDYDSGFPGSGTQFVGNHFSGSVIGLRIQLPFEPVLIRSNTFGNNGAAGLYIVNTSIPPGAVLVDHNTFNRNGNASGGAVDSTGRPINDGLHVDLQWGQGVTISRNRTSHNADFGIEAPNTVVDGGGNTSTGDPSGCAGVVCG